MAWWSDAVIYQIYPRSFADSDGDGIGDLPGIIARLDYLVELGVGAVWISPFFASPQEDFGYDITDYRGVAQEYGTLADVQELIAAAHDRGLRVIFDLVLNHTSDQHPWFQRSASSRTNPKSDWYIWADGRGRGGRKPPNNWRSALEITSAWQYSPVRQQWYLATFLPFQPDLNWQHPAVVEEMFNTVRFWLDLGVDGFRLDIFGQIMKDPRLRNNPRHFGTETGFPRFWRRQYNENTSANIELAKRLKAICAEYEGERVLIGEVFGAAGVLRDYLGDGPRPGLDLVFLFEFLAYRYDADWFSAIIDRFESSFPAPLQPTYVLENHDRSRTIDRVGGDRDKARVLAGLLLTLRGVPTIYQGQEIGTSNTYLPIRDALDPVASTVFRRLPEVVNRQLSERLNRDEVRTPMQWTAEPGAGFTSPGVRPWLPLNPSYRTVNVAAAQADPASLWYWYQQLLRLRATRSVLRTGSLTRRTDLPPGGLGYRRGRELEILANLGASQLICRTEGAAVVAASDPRIALLDGRVWLPPNSLVVLEIAAPEDVR